MGHLDLGCRVLDLGQFSWYPCQKMQQVAVIAMMVSMLRAMAEIAISITRSQVLFLTLKQ